MQLSIVIPCLNEHVTITRAVKKAHRAATKMLGNSFEVIVADNGSSDGSQKRVLTQGLARIVEVPIRGYGAALHWGILRARGNWVLFADADLSYDFAQLPLFWKARQAKDLVLGSRFQGQILPGAMPWTHRYIGTPILTALIRLLYGIKSTDSNSGMRMVRRAFYRRLEMRNSGMEWASELLIKTALHFGRYCEVPIILAPDQRHRAPHLLSWIDGWRHLKAIILLRPNSLISIVAFLVLLSLLAWLSSFALAFYFVLAAVALTLSLIAAKLLQLAINNTRSRTLDVLATIPVVPIAGMANIVFVLAALVLRDRFLSLELIVAGCLVVLDTWVFHVETIRTHLMNRLPSKTISIR